MFIFKMSHYKKSGCNTVPCVVVGILVVVILFSTFFIVSLIFNKPSKLALKIISLLEVNSKLLLDCYEKIK